MHLIKYTLTQEGKTPSYVLGDAVHGGQCSKPNGNPSPQDHTLVGVGNVDKNNLPENVEIISTKQDLSDYMNSFCSDNNSELQPYIVSNEIDAIWGKYEAVR